MQDIHAIGVGAGGRLYGGGGGGDRRLRPHHHHHHQGHGGQSPKCPRCDSANTKFCYYNNYNLSQPRHFCKSCRRYWTKGGVLRNVPVGGGCRKTKRNPSSSSSAKAKPPSEGRKKSGNSQSSSESSSLTASTATEVASSVVAVALRISDFPFSQDPMTSSSDPSDGGGIFSTAEVGSFTSMMTSSADPLMELNFGGVVEDQSLSHQHLMRRQGIVIQDAMAAMPEELKMQEITGGFLDQTCQMDMSGRHQSGLGTLDQELFDLTGTVDQGYWTQPQWTDTDHALYLP